MIYHDQGRSKSLSVARVPLDTTYHTSEGKYDSSNYDSRDAPTVGESKPAKKTNIVQNSYISSVSPRRGTAPALGSMLYHDKGRSKSMGAVSTENVVVDNTHNNPEPEN
jgi:hypothetical protein